MPFQPAPACAQAVMRYTEVSTGNFAYANVLNFVKTAGTQATVGDLTDLGVVIASWDASHNEVVRSQSYVLATIELRGLQSVESAYHTTVVGNSGTAAGQPLPLNVAACITLTTPFTGRSARGRLYHGGLAELQTNGNSLEPGVVTGINDSYAELLFVVTDAAVFEWCVLSRHSGGVLRENALPFVITSAALRDGILDTQKRRIDRLK